MGSMDVYRQSARAKSQSALRNSCARWWSLTSAMRVAAVMARVKNWWRTAKARRGLRRAYAAYSSRR